MHMQIDHFGNGLIRTTDPENLGVDTSFIFLSHVLSQLWPKNVIPAMAANLHITQNAQGCQGGIIQILDQHP